MMKMNSARKLRAQRKTTKATPNLQPTASQPPHAHSTILPTHPSIQLTACSISVATLSLSILLSLYSLPKHSVCVGVCLIRPFHRKNTVDDRVETVPRENSSHAVEELSLVDIV
ncbi:hypothetical protein BLNAU_3280 [Blattamonas nauphoetae]|uniref:Transmembrane protein n=1 Tax=Blattamonas nauphoetae TaxID=2049346 RepID=A0ABQ9YDK2_9EUKA|nr:hypothetical protein BLNAU_3280 [Blattamonas nauphoetae]